MKQRERTRQLQVQGQGAKRQCPEVWQLAAGALYAVIRTSTRAGQVGDMISVIVTNEDARGSELKPSRDVPEKT